MAKANEFLPYGRQQIDDADIKAVIDALTSEWLTTGPRVGEFERAFAAYCGASEGVAVNSGTAALHAAMRAVGVGPGDEVIVPAITFAATANAAVYEGAIPIFADVEIDTLLIDPQSVADHISERTRAIVAVDYAGQPADYDSIRAAIGNRSIRLVADACHSPGAIYKGRKVGTLADVSAFSFHPVKHMTTCEGGMAVTDNSDFAAHMRRFRNHGIDSDSRRREMEGTFAYDMVELGYNYRLPDVLCALGCAQLERLPFWIEARRALARRYDASFASIPYVTPLIERSNSRTNVYHLYVVRLDLNKLKVDRARAFSYLRSKGIGTNVHYGPVYLHSFYRNRGYVPGLCPTAEQVYQEILTLPLFPGMTEADVDRVVSDVTHLADLR
jgi:perosamine synthetase